MNGRSWYYSQTTRERLAAAILMLMIVILIIGYTMALMFTAGLFDYDADKNIEIVLHMDLLICMLAFAVLGVLARLVDGVYHYSDGHSTKSVAGCIWLIIFATIATVADIAAIIKAVQRYGVDFKFIAEACRSNPTVIVAVGAALACVVWALLWTVVVIGCYRSDRKTFEAHREYCWQQGKIPERTMWEFYIVHYVNAGKTEGAKSDGK